MIIDRDAARALAARWIAAWNSHDLERVFALYADDFEMRSPLIAERGWGAGISTAQPPLLFELLDAYGGVDTVAIHYRSVGRKLVVEILELAEDGRIIRGRACHGAPA